MKYPSLRQGLVGAWCPSLGATGYRLLDRSGYGNHGTLTNMDAGTDWVGGPYGTALDFDGVDDRVIVPDNASHKPSVVSVSVWLNRSGLATGFIVFKQNTRTTSFFEAYAISVFSSNIFAVASSSLGNQTAVSASITSGVWNHAVMIVKRPLLSLYFNSAVFSSTHDYEISYGTQPLSIGRGTDPSFLAPFIGKIDDVRIYNRELTPAEIRLLASEPGIGLKPERTNVYFADSLSSRRRKILTGLT